VSSLTLTSRRIQARLLSAVPESLENGDFDACQMLSDSNRPIPCTSFNGHLAVMVEDGPVLITRQQARDFFGFDD
jgi:hypothetical protein